MVYWHGGWEWNAKASRQKIHIFSLSLRLCWSNQVLNESIHFLSRSLSLSLSQSYACTHTHTEAHTCTHTLCPSFCLLMFLSPPQGVWLSRLGGMDLSLLIRLLNHLSLFQWPSSPALPACTDFLTCTAKIQPWKQMHHKWKQYSNWTAKNSLSVMNYSFLDKKHVNHTDQITNTSRNKRQCLRWTQFPVTINNIAKGNWVIVIYSNTTGQRIILATVMDTTDFLQMLMWSSEQEQTI